MTASTWMVGGAMLATGACGTQPSEGAAPEASPQIGTLEEALVNPAPGDRDFIHFETGAMRPMAMSADGSKMFVTNIPNGTLDIFDVDGSGNLTFSESVPVGVDPSAVAVRNSSEVWVVNHVSDSVSVVNVGSSPARVTKTLLVGDEPRDIVFAGGKAFITTAHRGQARALHPDSLFTSGSADPQLKTPSVPRADVWVFDGANTGAGIGGTPLKVVELFGDTPRPLTVSPDGNTVYVGIHYSGNQTSLVTPSAVCWGFDPNTPCEVEGVTMPGGDFGPSDNHEGIHGPHVSLMVKYDESSGQWKDLIGRNWNNAMYFRLPDKDVFALDVATLTESAAYKHVGTTLFNMATNPVSGKIYVTNSDAQNHNRFEGPGVHGGTTVQGDIARMRITVIDPSTGSVDPRHLNKHIDYSQLKAPAGTKDHSLATPMEMAVTADGSKLYVAAMGSNKIGVFDTSALEGDTFDPTVTSANYIDVPDGGPAGLLLSESDNKLYVFSRYADSVTVFNATTGAVVQTKPLFDPEPKDIKAGRKFLYDATLTSSNGEASCASCHIFGDADQLSWDLGNPDDYRVHTPLKMNLEVGGGDLVKAAVPRIDEMNPPLVNGTDELRELHPNKGPMFTQTFRGMQNHGPTHWRGDRVDGFYGLDSSAQGDPPYDARHSFKNFIVAFDGLIGRSSVLTDAEMESFTDFAMNMFMPPNAIRNLDNSLTADQEHGRQFYFGCEGIDSESLEPATCTEGPGDVLIPDGNGHAAAGASFASVKLLNPNLLFSAILNFGELSDVISEGSNRTCNGCHAQDPTQGFYGTDGSMSFDLLPQVSKVPQIRNMYTKVGMFGVPANARQFIQPGYTGVHQGDQVRGFGYMTNGSLDTLITFFNGELFGNQDNGAVGFQNNTQIDDIVDYVMAYPSDLAPIVGQQVTLTSSNGATVNPRINLMIQRAEATYYSKELGTGITECDLVASGVIGGVRKNWYYRASSQSFEPNDGGPSVSDGTLRGYAGTAGQEITYTCQPPGSGVRVALDNDRDGVEDNSSFETCPGDPQNVCSGQCTGSYMDCDHDINYVCESWNTSNSTHYNAGRATRNYEFSGHCWLGCYEYYAKGNGAHLGQGGDSSTLYREGGSGTNYTTVACSPSNGCEINGGNDVYNCGACGEVCDYANAGASCNSGTCVMGACAAGYTDCNQDDVDGCESDPMTDDNNCGGCGNACGYGQVCVAGDCECAPGHDDCDADPSNGCEINLQKETYNCGTCDNECEYDNAGAYCDAGSCNMGACGDGFSDCNSDPADGCESEIATDINNCGACGNVCPTPANGTATCDAGSCGAVCDAGFIDCDQELANGCEYQGTECPTCNPRTDTYEMGLHNLGQVPGCNTLTVKLWGAGGASGSNDGGYWADVDGGDGGPGGYATGVFTVYYGDQITLSVGEGGRGCTQAGQSPTLSYAGGFGGSGNNGAAGDAQGTENGGVGSTSGGNGGDGSFGGGGGGAGSGPLWNPSGNGGGGGAGSVLLINGNRLVAGGGGGGGGVGSTIASNGVSGGDGGSGCGENGSGSGNGGGGGGGGVCDSDGTSPFTSQGSGRFPYDPNNDLPSGRAVGTSGGNACLPGGNGYAILEWTD